MPIKDIKKRREYHQKYNKEIWYPKNRKKQIERSDRWKKSMKKKLEDYKRTLKCVDCGFSGKEYPTVLDFDHNSNDKEFLISQANRSWENIMKEIKKCDVRCANCHRIKTVQRKKGG